MIASNAREFIKSITNNLIMPLLQPILPFIQMEYVIHIGPFKFKFGQLVSDLIMFLINIYIIYVMMSAFSSDVNFKGAIAL
jgi:large-conductance mechanosensitive channel